LKSDDCFLPTVVVHFCKGKFYQWSSLPLSLVTTIVKNLHCYEQTPWKYPEELSIPTEEAINFLQNVMFTLVKISLYSMWKLHSNTVVIGENFGHNWLRPWCLQVQLVTCWHPYVFLYWFEVYFTNSYSVIGNPHEALNFNRYFLTSTGSYVTSCRFSPVIVQHYTKRDI
jgi:hypothetical protein